MFLTYDASHASRTCFSSFRHKNNRRKPLRDRTNTSNNMPPFARNDYHSLDACIQDEKHQEVSSEKSILASKLPLPTDSSPEQRTVSFNPLIQVTETINNDQYTYDEKRSTWYNACDLIRIREENLTTVRRFQRHTQYSMDCMRGLECYLPEPLALKQKARFVELHLVLREQCRQKNLGIYCAQRIEALCGTVSKFCQKEALDSAVLDAEDATLYQLQEQIEQKSDTQFEVDELRGCWFLYPLTWFTSKPTPAFVDTTSIYGAVKV